MKKIYKITHCNTDVHEDDYQHGEGDFVNCWSLREICPVVELTEFDSISDLLAVVNEKYLYEDKTKLKGFWYIFEDPDLKDEIRFDCDQQVDVDNQVADDDDIKQWKKGKKKLFAAHTVLYVKAVYIEETKYDEMYQDAKALGLDDI